MLAQQEKAGTGNQRHQKTGHADPHHIAIRLCIQLAPVELGDQQPVGTRHRARHAKYRYVAVIVPGNQLPLPRSPQQDLRRQQLPVLQRYAQLQRAAGSMAQLVQEQHLGGIAAEQQRFAAFGRLRPAVEHRKQALVRIDAQHQHRPRPVRQRREKIQRQSAVPVAIRAEQRHLAVTRGTQCRCAQLRQWRRSRAAAAPLQMPVAIQQQDVAQLALAAIFSQTFEQPGATGTVALLPQQKTLGHQPAGGQHPRIAVALAQPVGNLARGQVGNRQQARALLGTLLLQRISGGTGTHQRDRRGQEPQRTHRLAPLRQWQRRRNHYTAQQAIQQQRRQQYKQPALEHAGQCHLRRIAQQQLHCPVG